MSSRSEEGDWECVLGWMAHGHHQHVPPVVTGAQDQCGTCLRPLVSPVAPQECIKRRKIDIFTGKKLDLSPKKTNDFALYFHVIHQGTEESFYAHRGVMQNNTISAPDNKHLSQGRTLRSPSILFQGIWIFPSFSNPV